MKALKFTSEQIPEIVSKKRDMTWRLFDDKQLNVDDTIQFIDSQNGQVFGYARIDEITIKRISDLTELDQKGNEPYKDQMAILLAFRHFYGPDVSPESVVKVIRYTFLGENLASLKTLPVGSLREAKMFTDGGSRGNPGPSASAFIILDMDDNVVKKGGNYLGITTNNQAEYQAVRQGLTCAEEMGIKVVHIFIDSLLVVNQMIGVFKIKNRDLWPIHDDINNLVKRFEKVSFTHIPREMNKIADAKVNEILDNQDMSGLQSELL